MWNDPDLDAVWEADESGLQGWTVFLDTDIDGQLDPGESRTTTDSDGYYFIDVVTAGQYTVAQEAPSGWGQTWPTSDAHTVTVSTGTSWVEAGASGIVGIKQRVGKW